MTDTADAIDRIEPLAKALILLHVYQLAISRADIASGILELLNRTDQPDGRTVETDDDLLAIASDRLPEAERIAWGSALLQSWEHNDGVAHETLSSLLRRRVGSGAKNAEPFPSGNGLWLETVQ